MWPVDKKTAKPNFLNKSGHSHIKGRGTTTVYAEYRMTFLVSLKVLDLLQAFSDSSVKYIVKMNLNPYTKRWMQTGSMLAIKSNFRNKMERDSLTFT